MRCAVCGSERLSALGELTSGNRIGDQRFLRLAFPRTGFLRPRPSYDACFARACLDCGALIPFLGASARQQLNAEADSLSDVDSSY
jgi:hypothetical protein